MREVRGKPCFPNLWLTTQVQRVCSQLWLNIKAPLASRYRNYVRLATQMQAEITSRHFKIKITEIDDPHIKQRKYSLAHNWAREQEMKSQGFSSCAGTARETERYMYVL